MTPTEQTGTSAQKLAAIVQSSPDAIISVTLDGIVTSWNPAAVALYGYTEDEMLGRSLTVLIPPERSTDLQMILAAVSEGRRIIAFETERVRKDGRRIDVSVNASPIEDESGVVVGFAQIVHDVTERRRAHSHAERLRHQNEMILHSAGQGIYRVDLDGRTTFMNPAGLKILGWTAEELIGEVVHRLVHHTYCDGTPHPIEDCPIYAVLRDGIVRRIEDDCFWRKDGTPISVEYISAPIFEMDEVVGAVVTFNDITERKRAEELMREKERQAAQAYEAERSVTQKLRELDQLKNDFVGMIAHDLRSPLTVISGYGESLADKWDQFDEERRMKFLQAILDNAKKVGMLIDDVLHVAKIDSDEIRYQIAPYDHGELVRRTLEEYGMTASRRRYELQVEPELPLASGDEHQQWRIFSNLMSNAFKFSAPDSMVSVSVKREGDHIVTSVQDRGMGIAAEDLALVFDKFSRAKQQSGRDNIKGTGLGLYICRSLVRGQGGDIWVTSTPGEGSTFSYTVPVAR